MANYPCPKQFENALLVVDAVDRGIDDEIVSPQALELLEIASDERAAILRFKRRDILLPGGRIAVLGSICIHGASSMGGGNASSAPVRSNGEVEGPHDHVGQPTH